jgi:hypothetical protein
MVGGGGTDSGLLPTPTSPSPVRAGLGARPGGGGFGKKVPGLSDSSSDDDVSDGGQGPVGLDAFHRGLPFVASPHTV